MQVHSSNPQAAMHWSRHWTTAPLLPAACCFAAGILVARRFWLVPGYLLLLIGALVLLTLAARSFAERTLPLLLAAMWLALGWFCALAEPHMARDVALEQLRDGLLRGVEGSIVAVGPLHEENLSGADEPPELKLSRTIDLDLRRVERVSDDEDAWIPAHGRLRIVLTTQPGEELPALDCGATLLLDARLWPPRQFHDPGVWDRTAWLGLQGVTTEATVPVDRIRTMTPPIGTTFACRLSEWQHHTSERILSLAHATGPAGAMRLTEADANMLAAMLTGDRAHLATEVRVGFERTGCFHLLVVSGLHVAILAGLLFWLLRRFKMNRWPASLFSLLGAAAFGLLCGFGEPVQRSLLMLLLLFLGRLLFRDRSVLNVLGFAALGMLMLRPSSLFDAGLQMTVLSVVAAGGLARPLLEATLLPYHRALKNLRVLEVDPQLPPPIAQFRVLMRLRLTRIQQLCGRWIAWHAIPALLRFLFGTLELIVLSIAIELAMALPMAFYFHRITVAALPANLLILPAAGVLLPLALLLTPIALLVPLQNAQWVMAPLALALHLVQRVIASIADWRMADWRVATPLTVQILLSIALLAASVWLVRGGRWQRIAGCAVLLASVVAALWPPPVEHTRGTLQLEAIDVGQGDSLLVLTPDGHTLLVDGGGIAGPWSTHQQGGKTFDIGEDVVSQALWARGISHLDAVALSHGHNDHIEGLFAVLQNFHPHELWVGINPRSGEYLRLLQEAEALGVPVHSFSAGKSFAFGGSRVQVLAPPANYVPGASATNNDSLVMRVAVADGSSLLLEGDAEAGPEAGMVAAGGLESTLLKVGHHGSMSSTTPEFLAAVHPKMAVISVGRNNRYEHPRMEVLNRLEEARVPTYRTDLDGATCFTLEQEQVQVDAGCK